MITPPLTPGAAYDRVPTGRENRYSELKSFLGLRAIVAAMRPEGGPR
jgi:hypothetical protein